MAARAGDGGGDGRDWTRLHQALALMPAGTWTTYGDLAELIGSHPVPVGVHLATQQVRGAWRALTVDGTPSPQFRWTDPGRTGSQRAVLEDDGVVFDSAGRAIPEQRLSGAELADLVGLDVPSETPGLTTLSSQDPYDRFMYLLEKEQNSATATGVQQFLDRWDILGGTLNFGRADETSCFPILDHPTGQIWPVAIYPRTGSVEVVFQHLARRTPFDDPSVRRELLDRLNRIDGIRLPEAKLSMRPSFPIDVLGRPGAAERVGEILDWFAEVCIAADGAPRPAGTGGAEEAL